MSEASKGPWYLISDPGGVMFDVVSADNEGIALVLELVNHEETVDNAKLMARAWQMDQAIRSALRALKSLESEVDVVKLLQDALQEPESIDSVA